MLFISGRNETSIIPAWQKLMGLTPFTLTAQDKKHAGVQFFKHVKLLPTNGFHH